MIKDNTPNQIMHSFNFNFDKRELISLLTHLPSIIHILEFILVILMILTLNSGSKNKLILILVIYYMLLFFNWCNKFTNYKFLRLTRLLNSFIFSFQIVVFYFYCSNTAYFPNITILIFMLLESFVLILECYYVILEDTKQSSDYNSYYHNSNLKVLKIANEHFPIVSLYLNSALFSSCLMLLSNCLCLIIQNHSFFNELFNFAFVNSTENNCNNIQNTPIRTIVQNGNTVKDNSFISIIVEISNYMIYIYYAGFYTRILIQFNYLVVLFKTYII
jgi:hypothetical protein